MVCSRWSRIFGKNVTIFEVSGTGILLDPVAVLHSDETGTSPRPNPDYDPAVEIPAKGRRKARRKSNHETP